MLQDIFLGILNISLIYLREQLYLIITSLFIIRMFLGGIPHESKLKFVISNTLATITCVVFTYTIPNDNVRLVVGIFSITLILFYIYNVSFYKSFFVSSVTFASFILIDAIVYLVLSHSIGLSITALKDPINSNILYVFGIAIIEIIIQGSVILLLKRIYTFRQKRDINIIDIIKDSKRRSVFFLLFMFAFIVMVTVLFNTLMNLTLSKSILSWSTILLVFFVSIIVYAELIYQDRDEKKYYDMHYQNNLTKKTLFALDQAFKAGDKATIEAVKQVLSSIKPCD